MPVKFCKVFSPHLPLLGEDGSRGNQFLLTRDLPGLVSKEDHGHASELNELVTSQPRPPTRAF